MGAADRTIRSKRAPNRYSPEPSSIRPQRKRKPTKSPKSTKNTPKTISKKSKKLAKVPAVAAAVQDKPKRGAPKSRKTPSPLKKRRTGSFKKAGPRPKEYKTPEAGEVSPITPPPREVKVKRERGSRSGSGSK